MLFCACKGSCELRSHCGGCSVYFSSVCLLSFSSPAAQGQMANHMQASLCTLVFLLSLSVLGFGLHQVQFLDETDDISFQNTITFDNSTSVTDPPGQMLYNLTNGTAWDYAVPPNVTTILTAFNLMKPSGHFFQDVFTWSNAKTDYVNCTTNCSWKIDDSGFSVTDLSQGGAPHFVVDWTGPYPPS